MSKWVVLGVILLSLCADGLWMRYRIGKLEKKNAELTEQVTDAKKRLTEAELWVSRVDSAMQEMEVRDADRRTELARFSQRLNTLGKTSEPLGVVLSTPVPDELVIGLRAFGSAAGADKGAGHPASAGAAPGR